MRCLSTSTHWLFTALRAVVRRRVEVVGHAPVFVGRLDQRVALAERMRAEGRDLLEQIVERPPRSGT
jgi:hypothetical protein